MDHEQTTLFLNSNEIYEESSALNAGTHERQMDDSEVDLLISKLNPHSGITLQEQLEIPFTTLKKQQAENKMALKMKTEVEKAETKKRIVKFLYATDYSFLRRISPDQLWNSAQRRQAWAQYFIPMLSVSALQIAVCILVLLENTSDVSASTLVLSFVFLSSLALSNTLTVCWELTCMISRVNTAYTSSAEAAVTFYLVCLLLCPFLIPLLTVAYIIVFLLDLTNGPILSVCYESMTAIIVRMLIASTTLVASLRSSTILDALQICAGFAFLYSLDDWIISKVDIDLLAPARRNVPVAGRITAVRVLVYVLTLIAIGGPMYVLCTAQRVRAK
mmetsp:Transcript_81289/g.159579  ORF Transcript_81289/g.159579 Transcript_81289/m.159579 type:complete len:332 (-) Transcript_81289:173-1168(-)